MQTFAHRPEIAQRPTTHQPKNAAGDTTAHQLQRSIGNLAVQRMYAKPSTESAAGGGPNGTQAQPTNGSGSAVPSPQATVPATDISTTDTSPPAFTSDVHFNWAVKWSTDGRNGWIVQRILPTVSGQDANGVDITPARFGTPGPYFEAWRVDGQGNISGGPGTSGNMDRWWLHFAEPLGSTFAMSFSGNVYWTSQDPAQSGFTYGGVNMAHGLLSSTTAPPGLSQLKLTRGAYGVWNQQGRPTYNFTFGV